MATETCASMTSMFEQLQDHFNRTLKAGTEFQEQTARFWKDLVDQGGEHMRQQFEKVTGEVTPFSKANIERFQRMFDQQADRTVELLHETFEVGKADSPAALYQELLRLWRQSFDGMRESNEMFAKANADMFEQFCRMARGSHRAEPKAAVKTK